MLHISELTHNNLDIQHLDVMAFCPYLGETIFRYLSITKNGMKRVTSKLIGQYAQTHELIFGNLYQREIIFQYLERFGYLGFYNARIADNIISEVKQQIQKDHIMPVLGRFDTEEQLYKHFEEHAREYLSQAFNVFNGFKFDRVDTIKIPCYNYTITQPVVVRKFGNLEQIDYFKLTIGDQINAGYIIYPPDMVMLLTHTTNYKFVRVFNLYKNKSSTINMRIYNKIAKRREITAIQEQLSELDMKQFTRHNYEYTPNLWTYQCDTCIMKHVCHTYAYKLWNQMFRRSTLNE